MCLLWLPSVARDTPMRPVAGRARPSVGRVGSVMGFGTNQFKSGTASDRSSSTSPGRP